MDKIGVVIPAYNAEKSIGPLIEGLLALGFCREALIIVDDGSKDNTVMVAEGYKVDILRNNRNIGKGFSLNRGFQRAISKGLKKVFTIDADGQHRVADIKEFLKIKNEYDLIIGTRLKNSPDMPFIRRLVNRVTSLVISLLSKRYIPDVQSGFRLIDLSIFNRIILKTKNFQTESELVYKAVKNGYRIGFVPIATLYNSEKSYIMPVIDTIRFINMAVRFLWV
ncbi:MAG: glycosyltransferase family 2 protein [candidate division WOR-3 bacterium]|nr:glycosyltransferase family 2 protein [candidate division WOR-3 bacterium]